MLAQVISGHYKRHSLTLTFDLVISPEEEYFSYRTNVMFDQKEPGELLCFCGFFFFLVHLLHIMSCIHYNSNGILLLTCLCISHKQYYPL